MGLMYQRGVALNSDGAFLTLVLTLILELALRNFLTDQFPAATMINI